MKIIVVIPTYYPKLDKGGPIISLYNQLNDLSKNHYLEVLTSQKINSSQIKIQKKNRYINYNIINYRFLNIFRYFFKIKNFDLVYINSIFSIHSLKFIFLANIYKKKILISPRGSINEISIKRKKSLKKFIISIIRNILDKKFVKFITTSEMERNEVINFFSNFKIEILPNGLNKLNLFYQSINTNKKDEILNFIDHKTILYFSRIDRKKNLNKLIDVLGNNKLLIVGDYSDQKYFDSLDLSNTNIKYSGPIYDQDLIKGIFKRVSFLCLPSNFENFANCILDSIYYGCPVLISENIGLKDLIKNFNMGHIFQNEINVQDLIFTFKNIKKYKNNISINKDKILRNYSWPEINKRFIDMILY